MSDKSPLTKYARLWLALGPNLALVLLAWFLPHDGEDRGPALLSIAGHQHFILLHFPVAILILIPVFEIWDRHNEAGLLIRRLSLLGAVSIWATCVFGVLEAYFNGSDYSNLDTHLWTGIGRARSGCGAAIVGTPDQVLAKLRAYQAEGIEAFILSGYPHLQEADMFARHVLPHIQHGPLDI